MIDIEKLAREAGVLVCRHFGWPEHMAEQVNQNSPLFSQYFAALVLEEAAKLSIECGDDVLEGNKRHKTPLSNDWMKGAYGCSRLVAEELRTLSRQITEDTTHGR